MPRRDPPVPVFLRELLAAHAPSGTEAAAQAVFDRHLEPVADAYQRDALGNRHAVLNPAGAPHILLAGHLDEIGLIVTHIHKDGYLYFDTIGGHDRTLLPGRRVLVHTREGVVRGVTGRRAIHLMEEADRKKAPEVHEVWIDIGARDRREAQARVAIGDVVTHDTDFLPLHGTLAAARAFDNRAGAYAVGETLLRLREPRRRLAARLTVVATAQEEIGVRGATVAAFAADPQFAVAVDVTHATDHPDTDPRRHGDIRLGAGPAICRGPNIHPLVARRLVACAEENEIPYQLEADPRPTGTDARAIQISRAGVATGLVSIPLRYMHTPAEVVDLTDVEHTVRLLVAFVRSLKAADSPAI